MSSDVLGFEPCFGVRSNIVKCSLFILIVSLSLTTSIDLWKPKAEFPETQLVFIVVFVAEVTLELILSFQKRENAEEWEAKKNENKPHPILLPLRHPPLNQILLLRRLLLRSIPVEVDSLSLSPSRNSFICIRVLEGF